MSGRRTQPPGGWPPPDRARLGDRDEGELIMVSRWRDRDAFKSYMRSADHRVSHDRIDPELQAAIKLERLEHLHTYEVVAE